jgi:hypothetical protein
MDGPTGPISNTYYIEGSEQRNRDRQGSLAINPVINENTHIISWQDSTSHPKSRHFDHITFGPDESIVIEEQGRTVLRLVLLTVTYFQEYIRANVPIKYRLTDEQLRAWYSHFAENPEDPELYRDDDIVEGVKG